jgi:putative ABC transport system permease protein
MQTIRAFIVRLFNLFGKRRQDREFAEEMESHLVMHVEDNLRSGMNPEAARRNALLKLGGMDRTYEECRDRLGFRLLADMRRDFRHSLRRLVKSPLLSLVVILSLGLGIGANTAVFSMMRQVLLRSLPVERPEELSLVTASGNRPGGQRTGLSGGSEYIFSYAGLRQFENQQKQDIAEIAGFHDRRTVVAYKEGAVHGNALMVSGGYFRLMGTRPFMGRMLMPDDDRGAGNPVAVLGYNFWKNRLGGRTDILNQPIRIAAQVFTIVGVAPKGFYGTTVNLTPDVFIPISAAVSMTSFRIDSSANNFWIYLVARLRTGVTRQQAAAAYGSVYASIVEEQIVGMPDWLRYTQQQIDELRGSRLQFIDGSRGYSRIQDSGKKPLLILTAVTGMILLIAMANAANLLLARSAARREELAVCVAIGAGRGRIMGQLLSEALILAIAGGVMGIAVAFLTLRFLIALLAPSQTPIDFLTIQPEWPVLLYGLGLSVFTGLLFGAYPALQAVKMTPARELSRNSAKAAEAFGAARVRKTLVCAQVALSIILLIPTGLLLKSLVNLMNVDPGLPTENLITFGLAPGEAGYDSDESRALFDRAEHRLAALPGVTGITTANNPFLNDLGMAMLVTVEDSNGGRQEKWVKTNQIAPGFFGQMGIPLIRGREFTESDGLPGSRVVIVNEKFADTFFPGQNPVGRSFSLPGFGNSTPVEIIGIVSDFHNTNIRHKPSPYFYEALTPDGDAFGRVFYIRTGLPPERLMTQVRQTLREVDAGVPPQEMRTMEDQARRTIYDDRMMFQLAGLCAALALFLAMMGLYGVMAYSVLRRTHEFGIRMAVGAQPSGIRRMVLREMFRILIAGLVVGIPIALAICNLANSRWLGAAPGMTGPLGETTPINRLFGVSASDPVVVAGAAVALGLAALAAAYLPAWRASRIDPMKALRFE